ncbi:unnamed protein product [Cylicocyclus nassatus]|uniref:Uncharacterized protein n=1 Tax=Cylicocyclus nassatus TaxID=53992 RepID=A0AA36GKC5_CYLNA|nr:unnamed protein product [Cylicocyclus nassatus]
MQVSVESSGMERSGTRAEASGIVKVYSKTSAYHKNAEASSLVGYTKTGAITREEEATAIAVKPPNKRGETKSSSTIYRDVMFSRRTSREYTAAPIFNLGKTGFETKRTESKSTSTLSLNDISESSSTKIRPAVSLKTTAQPANMLETSAEMSTVLATTAQRRRIGNSKRITTSHRSKSTRSIKRTKGNAKSSGQSKKRYPKAQFRDVRKTVHRGNIGKPRKSKKSKGRRRRCRSLLCLQIKHRKVPRGSKHTEQTVYSVISSSLG